MSIDGISIRDIYKQVNHISEHGVPGYYVPKKYADPIQMMKSRELSNSTGKLKRYETKRGNFLEDASNLKKFVPGPGKYTYSCAWPQKTKSLHHPSKKMTYIDELMKREKKEKKPAPGQYNVVKTDKEVQAEKKKMAERKVKATDKINYLDKIQYEATLTPGVGMYNPRDRVKTEGSKMKTSPDEWRKKHENMEKNKKVPKMPDMRTYHPVPADFSLFESISKARHNKNFLGKIERFKTQPSGSGLPPGKYALLQQWRGKEEKKKQRHGLESISKGISKSVYYH